MRIMCHAREGAVRIVRETNKPIAQVAADLGIHAGTLAKPWRTGLSRTRSTVAKARA